MLLIITTIFGLIIGSFLNVVIFRYPKMLKQRWKAECMDYLKQPLTHKPRTYNLAKPRSHCRKCRKKLKWWHLLPLFSYLFLRGKCAYCKKPISIIYPIVEILSAMAAVIAVYHFGLSGSALFAIVFSWALIVLAFIDAQHQILPDSITLSVLWIGLLGNALTFYTTTAAAITGVIVGYLSLWIIAKLFALLRKKEGMGHGDFKMFAMIGAWLGSSLLLNVLLTSVLAALIVQATLLITKKISKKNPFAFGPYLAIGAWTSFIFGPILINWITRMT